jgi:hypothetical protein
MQPEKPKPLPVDSWERAFARAGLSEYESSWRTASPALLHLLAAQQASAEIVAAFEQRNTIEGRAETANGNAPTTPADLLTAPIPTE